MRLYLSGPMTGIAEFNYPAFKAARAELEEAGYEVKDPSSATAPADATWADYMRSDIRDMLTCRGVATMPGWHNSRGAWLEVTIARELGMAVRTVEEWITHTDCECVPCLTSNHRIRNMS